MDSYRLDFRKTNTDVPAVASTPGKECLTSPAAFAKGILPLGSIFRASRARASPAGFETKYSSNILSPREKTANEV